MYKGKIQRIERTTNKLIVKEENWFLDWRWQVTLTRRAIDSYTYSKKTQIFVGNEQIKQDRLRYYANNEVYFVTVNKFGKEVIEKMVIKKEYERTFYERMRFVNSAVENNRVNGNRGLSVIKMERF